MTEDQFFSALPKLAELLEKAKHIAPHASPAWREKLRSALQGFRKAVLDGYGIDLAGDSSPSSTCFASDTKAAAGATTTVFRYSIEGAGTTITDAVSKGAYDLALNEVPEVFEFRKCADGDEHDIVHVKDVLGLYQKRRNEVYVRSDLGYRETLEVLGHELFHAKERQDGLTTDENACDDYGQRFADWLMYGTRT